MNTFGVIENNIIVNIIVADSKEIAETVSNSTCVEIPVVPGGPGIGWTYDGAELTAPVVEETE